MTPRNGYPNLCHMKEKDLKQLEEIETEQENFSGVIILHFNQGGLRGIEKLKKVA